MIKQLQGILDRQAKALEQRNSSITAIRLELDSLLASLELKLVSDLASIESRLVTQRNNCHASQLQNSHVKRKLEEAESELNDLADGGPAAASIAENRLELEEINKQVELLTIRKQALVAEIENKESLNDAKCTQIRQLIASLNSQFTEFDDSKVQALESELAEFQRNHKAFANGRTLWGQVCDELAQVDKKVNTADLPGSLVALETACEKLFSHLEYAKLMKWQLLVTAIGHEYLAVSQALEAVRKAITIEN